MLLSVLVVTTPSLLNQEKGKDAQNRQRRCPQVQTQPHRHALCVCQGTFDFGLKSPGAKIDGDSCACLCVIQGGDVRLPLSPEQVTVKAVPFCKAFSPRRTCGCGHKEGTGRGGSHRWSQGPPGSVILAPGESLQALQVGALQPLVRWMPRGPTGLPVSEAIGAEMCLRRNQLLPDIDLIKV